jgi:hypothetical protein
MGRKFNEWLYLAPDQSVELKLPPVSGDPGTYTYGVCIEQRDGPPIRAARIDVVLPGLDYAGAPWHGSDSIDLTPIGCTRFEFQATVHELAKDSDPLDLEAYVADAKDRIVFNGKMKRLSDHSAAIFRTVYYELPAKLPPGKYRLLVRDLNAERFFMGIMDHKCDASPAASSRWIEFVVSF